ncbi:MAG: DUF1553 domain-containing protein [Bryobacterales bacterium]|nr:DUF1553 domain-containing protein [Bryobacterales bacterium]
MLKKVFSAVIFILPLPAAAGDAVRLDPPGIVLAGPDAVQRLLITRFDDSGGMSDAASTCQLSSARPEIVAIQGTSLRAVSPGESVITANCEGGAGRTTVKVAAATVPVEISFPRDVISILTTKGCNSSACHGSPAGQSGFKLSLYGSDPAADFNMIVESHGGRRVNRGDPQQSLILRKPSFQVPHGGGHLFTNQADEYQTILQWLVQGAKPSSGGPRIQSIELYPRERTFLARGVRQPVVVIGRLSDGSTRDMTGEVRYSVNDEAVVSSVSNSTVTAKGRGLTVIMARGMGKTATAQMIVVDGASAPGITTPPGDSFIDRHVFAKLRQVKLAPFPATPDSAFLRRVYLDAIGVLPTPRETGSFLGSADPAKRAQLIDRLLERPEYVSHWLVKYEDWFRNSQYYSQGRTNASFKRYLAGLIREDRPFDEAAREMITATGDTTVHPAGNFWHPAMDFMLKTFEVSKATPTVTRLFLGQRIECAECHNHPLENLTQDDFYGMAAFFARLKVKHGYAQYRRIWYNAREGEVLHPASKQPVAPKFLDGAVPQIAEGQDRREVLADWITRAQTMQFARAAANRIWSEYFGAGIVEPADDFRSTNMPTHPELLDGLAKAFIESGFRFKPLHRLILNSQVYQLSSRAPGRPGGVDPLEKLLLARYEPRKLPAEVLLDAIVQVTGVPQEFTGYPPGTSPKDLVAANGSTYFLTTFGVPRRDIMEPRSQEPSLSQALHLMNSDAVRDKIEKPGNILGELLERTIDDREVLDALYLRAYSRKPTAKQWQAVESYLASEKEAGRSRRRMFENVLWTILNSKEFQLNQ